MNDKPYSNRERVAESTTVAGTAERAADKESGVAAVEFRRLFESVSGVSFIVHFMELLPSAVYICEAASGVITHYNRRAAELWGRAPVVGDTYERFYGSLRLYRADGTPLSHLEAPMAEVLIGGSPVRNQELVIERSDGSRIITLMNIDPLNNSAGEIIGAINVFEDVTDWRKAEQGSRRLAAIVESSEDAIISKDLNGIITTWNQSAERIFGYTTEEIVGKPITLLIPPDRHDEEPGILERIRRGERIEHYETVRRRKDGALLDISLTVSPIRDALGNIVGASKIARDITRHKLIEKALRQSEERSRQEARELEKQLIMSGRLVSIGEVTASMAHEFNNPLGIIMGFVEDMLGSTDPASPNYRALQIIDEEAKRCRQIVRDLMEYARPKSTEFCSTSIADIIEKTLQLVQNRLYKQKVAREKIIEPDLPRIQADASQLEQVLVNLYLNAIDAMPEGGNLTIKAGIARSDGCATAIITVADTGLGIADTDLPKIFQPFFTAKKRRGIGLGLPICERIVKNHGGRIEVESQQGKGSTFKIYLPLDQPLSGKTDNKAI
jgi:PAS domain S-box-containing protein